MLGCCWGGQYLDVLDHRPSKALVRPWRKGSIPVLWLVSAQKGMCLQITNQQPGPTTRTVFSSYLLKLDRVNLFCGYLHPRLIQCTPYRFITFRNEFAFLNFYQVPTRITTLMDHIYRITMVLISSDICCLLVMHGNAMKNRYIPFPE